MEKVDKGWFEARYDIFAYLGLLTFLFLMSLLVFAVVMSICCWLCLGGRRLDKQKEKNEVVVLSIPISHTRKREKVKELEERVKTMERGKVTLESLLDPRNSHAKYTS